MAICILLASTLLLSISVHSPVSAGWETEAALEGWIHFIDSGNLKTTLMKAMAPVGGVFTWRSSEINQWLVRWDRRQPRNIFRGGFSPSVDLANVIEDQSNGAMDLRTYVALNTPSVFVSTTQVIRPNGRFWMPRNRANSFRYDIFAPGGIDVNPTLGRHQHDNQDEIAFIGGIHTRYIFGAVELDNQMRQYRYHLNPNYQGQPPTRRPRYCPIPHVYYSNLSPVPQLFCANTCNSGFTKRSTNNHNNLMRSDGILQDPTMSCSYCYKVDVTSIYFSQSAEYGLIEPYGHIDVFIQKLSPISVWSVSYYSDIPQVKQLVAQNGKCAILQSDAEHNPRVCFQGEVHEYDPASLDDNLSNFMVPLCKDANSQSLPPMSYSLTTTGTEGDVKLDFTVQPCGDCHNSDDNCC